MAEGSGSGVLRLLSGQRIVDALFAAHPARMSRAGIARATGLSKPTVSALVADMESAGLVRVSDESPSSGSIGRPAALYELVPAARHSVVADIARGQIAGFGWRSYTAAIEIIAGIIEEESTS